MPIVVPAWRWISYLAVQISGETHAQVDVMALLTDHLTDAEVTVKMPYATFRRFADSSSRLFYVDPKTLLAQVHVIDMSLSDGKAAAAILHACVSTGFFYGMPQNYNMAHVCNCS